MTTNSTNKKMNNTEINAVVREVFNACNGDRNKAIDQIIIRCGFKNLMRWGGVRTQKAVIPLLERTFSNVFCPIV